MWLANEYVSNNYYSIVNDALSNENIFNTFKSNPYYGSIVGMSSHEQGVEWYSNIKKNYKNIIEDIEKYSKNDICGAPTYNDLPLSPNTLRYINTLIEIDDFFKLKGRINILELGVGYGGLCFVLNQYYSIDKYCLIDIPSVQSLSTKYLDTIGVKGHTTDVPDKIDLFISEFCLSEFDDKGMYEFYEKYVLKSEFIN